MKKVNNTMNNYIKDNMNHLIYTKRHLTLICLLLTYLLSNAQDYSKERIVPPNPIAASFKLYGDIPVSYSTGVPDITIPLYTIQIGDFSLPIELKYHINSLKPASCRSNVALGWSLHYGGIVSRSVYGKPDEFYELITFGDGLGVSNSPILRDILKNDPNGFPPSYGDRDSEHDIFNYLIPGTSGEFILGVNHIPYQMSKHPVSIKYLEDSKFDITNDHGDVFKFGYGQKESTISGPLPAITSSWLLSQINLASNHNIDFNYEEVPYYWTGSQEYQLSIMDKTTFSHVNINTCLGIMGSGPFICDGPSYDAYVEKNVTIGHSEKNIKEINFPNGKIVFDLSLDKRIITGIRVFQGTRLIKTFEFNCPATGGSMGGMNLMRKIIIKDGNSEKISEYQFTYYDENIVNAATVRTDYWGYCNSTQTNYFPFGQYRVGEGQSCYPPQMGFLPYSITVGHSKEPDLSYCLTNALKQIIYPTGGFTQFEYSLNEFKMLGAIENGNGLRVKKVITGEVNEQIITKTFEYEPQEKNGEGVFQANNFVNSSYSVGVLNDALSIARIRTYGASISSRIANHLLNIHYSKVTEIMGDGTNNLGKNVYYYQYNNDHERSYFTSAFPIAEIEVPSFYLSKYRNWDNGLLYKKETYAKNGSQPVAESLYNYEYHYDPTPFKNTYVFKVSNYNHTDALMDDSTIRECLSRILLDLPPVYGYYNYDIVTGWLELESETQTEKRNGKVVTKTTNYKYNGAQTYYPSSIISSKSDGTNDIIIRKYPYDFSAVPYSNMVAKNILNPLVEQEHLNETTFLDSVRINYFDWGNNIFKPITIETKNGNNSFDSRLRYHAYDSYGNVLSVSKENDVKDSYVWGYNNSYPVIKGENIDESSLKAAIVNSLPSGFTSLEELLNGINGIGNMTTDAQQSLWNGYIVNLVNNSSLNKALVSAYTYIPLVGMTSQTDSNGITTYYEYDDFGRLLRIKNNKKQILKEYEYNYKNN